MPTGRMIAGESMDVTFLRAGPGEIEARLGEGLHTSEKLEEARSVLRSSGLVPVPGSDEQRFVTKIRLGGAGSGEQAAHAVIELHQIGLRVGAEKTLMDMLNVQPLMMLHGTFREQTPGDIARLIGAEARSPAGYCGQLNTFIEAALLWCRDDATAARAQLAQSLLGLQDQLDVLRSDLAGVGMEFSKLHISESRPRRRVTTEPSHPNGVTGRRDGPGPLR
jgi:hypothetical protein